MAEILGIPQYVIEDLGIVWRTLASGMSIDPEKFGTFCDNFVEKFQKDTEVHWYLFSPTIHKVLFHGKQAIEYFPVPIGWLSEVFL